MPATGKDQSFLVDLGRGGAGEIKITEGGEGETKGPECLDEEQKSEETGIVAIK